MTEIYFTLCSNNYLSFALTLEKSVRKFIPDAQFIIGLVDQKDQAIDYAKYTHAEVIPCFDLGYSEYDQMLKSYNIIEFNTAVKPFYFEYLFEKYPNTNSIYYLDPDLFFYQSPMEMESYWGEAHIMLTPNQLYFPPKTTLGELASLRHGVNNLGFIGVRRKQQGLEFISWWKERLIEHCKIDKCRGIFVDQKWVDLAPLYFDKIKYIKHPGWNMAWWNFSERQLLKTDDTICVNSHDFPLLFFHFSGFKPDKKQTTERLISKEVDINDDDLLSELYENYRSMLLESDHKFLSKRSPLIKFYQVPNSRWNRIGRFVKSKSTNLIFRIFKV